MQEHSSLFAFAGLQNYLAQVGEAFRWSHFRVWEGERCALLRHDVDLCLKAALRLSHQLASWHIPSTYFILVNSPNYSPTSAEGRAQLRAIQDNGGEIALHFDPQVYPETPPQQMHTHVAREAEWLSFACGSEVRSVSLHNPHALGTLPLFEGFVNAYDERIFQPDRYLSDSCRRFRRDPWEFLEQVRHAPNPIQILLHPLHYHDQERSYREIFAEFHQDRRASLEAAFRQANATYVAEMAPQ